MLYNIHLLLIHIYYIIVFEKTSEFREPPTSFLSLTEEQALRMMLELFRKRNSQFSSNDEQLISPRQLQTLIVAKKSQPNLNLPARPRYTFQRENLFSKALSNAAQERNSQEPIKERDFISNIVLLYMLFVSNPVKKRKSFNQAIKSLETLIKKNKRSSLPIDASLTIGYEIEYEHPLSYAKQQFVTLANEVNLPLSATPISVQASFHQDFEKKDKSVKKLRKVHTELFGGSTDHPNGILYDLANISRYMPGTSALKSVRAFPHGLERSNSTQNIAVELRTQPSFSYIQPLREVFQLHKTMNFANSWNLHDTIMGVEISPEHTEIMDVLLVSAAADLLPEKVYESMIARLEDNQQDSEFSDPVLIEKLPKIVKETVYKNQYYFPFHRPRKKQELSGEYLALGSSSYGVERRSLFDYQISEQIKLIREKRFSALASCCIRAKQSNNNHNIKNSELVHIWDLFMQEWKELCRKKGIPLLTQKDYYLFSEKPLLLAHDGSNLQSRYSQILSAIVIESALDQDFRAEARKLIRRFNAKVKNVCMALEETLAIQGWRIANSLYSE